MQARTCARRNVAVLVIIILTNVIVLLVILLLSLLIFAKLGLIAATVAACTCALRRALSAVAR